MNAINLARTAYDPSAAPVRTPRSLEYEAFARTTRKLRDAAKSPRNNMSILANALHENRTLWNFMASCVADKDNELPVDLRARLFYLSEFTTHQSRRILKGEADLSALISINTAVMSGLRGQGNTP